MQIASQPNVATGLDRRKSWNKTKVNLFVDLGIFLAFLITMAPRLGNIAIHEWLSIAFAAAIIAHLLLHWQWIVNTIRRFLGTMNRTQRVNFVLNSALFIDFTVIMFSGFMISQAALPQFGIYPPPGFAWRQIHDIASNIALVMLGLHLALHWQWIVSSFTRFLIKPFQRKSDQHSTLAESKES